MQFVAAGVGWGFGFALQRLKFMWNSLRAAGGCTAENARWRGTRKRCRKGAMRQQLLQWLGQPWVRRAFSIFAVVTTWPVWRWV
jgi:hypothetical protein